MKIEKLNLNIQTFPFYVFYFYKDWSGTRSKGPTDTDEIYISYKYIPCQILQVFIFKIFKCPSDLHVFKYSSNIKSWDATASKNDYPYPIIKITWHLMS